MLEIEIDVFSGNPNPTFQLSAREEQEFVDRLLAEPSQMAPVMDPEQLFGLGYRGVIARLAKTDDGPWSRTAPPKGSDIPRGIPAPAGALPIEFRLGTRQARGYDDAAAWLLELSQNKIDIANEVREVVYQGVTTVPTLDEGPDEGEFRVDEDKEAAAPRGATWWACNSPYYSANASYFNKPEYVGRNNCYCFASNHLANVRYALPGRRGGRPSVPPAPQCWNVIDGLRADGWIDGCQINTLTIALVIWPDQDYHFYRVVTSGAEWWWGHKPGATPARYTDNSGRALKQPLSPINCDRGPYAHFCGYFYQNNNTAYVA
jgi:hypothetical protein